MLREAPTPVIVCPAADLLDAAADRLERTGWRQHGMGGEQGPNCAAGALAEETHGKGAAYVEALEALGEGIAEGWVTDWNDDPSQTAEGVVAKLRGTARIERSKRGVRVV